MSYKLYTDKQEVFECKIYLEGASLTKATTRVVIQTNDLNLMFEGKIDKEGNCKVPIKKLRGLLGENDKGTMKLEVIAEDTYFLPWESDFVVGTEKKIKVEVKQQSKSLLTSSKPKMVVEEINHPFDPVDKIVDVLHKQGVNVFTIYEEKKRMLPILKKYVTKIGYTQGAKKFIKEVIQKLSKK
jgi:hypothetical protein